MPNQREETLSEEGEAFLEDLISGMTKILGRLPTEDEVMSFIYGGNLERLEIIRAGMKPAFH